MRKLSYVLFADGHKMLLEIFEPSNADNEERLRRYLLCFEKIMK